MSDVAYPSLGGMHLTVVKNLHKANLQARAHVHWNLKVNTSRMRSQSSQIMAVYPNTQVSTIYTYKYNGLAGGWTSQLMRKMTGEKAQQLRPNL